MMEGIRNENSNSCTIPFEALARKRICGWVLALTLGLCVSTVCAQQWSYGRYAPSRFSDQAVADNWNSPEGRARLQRATAAGTAVDFYQLAHHFQPQINGLYCGIASSVIVMNALRTGQRPIPSQPPMEIAIPSALGGGRIPYPLYAQQTFLDEQTERVKPRSVIEFVTTDRDGRPNPGLMLQELRGILAAHGADVVARHADADEADGVAAFREEVRAIFAEAARFMIVNYDSRALGQAGGGHISPLAAYDAATDHVLLLDVSGHMNPWIWIPLRDLYLAMHTRDGSVFRGYVIVAEGSSAQ